MANTPIVLAVSDFIAIANQTLSYAFAGVCIEGEVASFSVNQGKYVFFDIKDSSGTLNCFMTVWNMRQPLQNGMKIAVYGEPKLTAKGKFSFTVSRYSLKGEGAIKKSFDILRKKLSDEGLFNDDKKRSLPRYPKRVAVISSQTAAGYKDFISTVMERWGGVEYKLAHVQVQGVDAPDQIIRALKYFQTSSWQPEVIAIIRGGGSADDLAAFNDEQLVREVAGSRVPVLTGIGHEIDTSLVDLAADVAAITPSHAAQLIVPHKGAVTKELRSIVRERVFLALSQHIAHEHHATQLAVRKSFAHLDAAVKRTRADYTWRHELARELNPARVLERGYAVLRGTIKADEIVHITTHSHEINAEIIDVKRRAK
ncbi:exodeoxyribonuclease VII large subunit [Candidatus Saccharibacteria bacterium]|nr:exodeoxyribonuclease VII large subunit [Candidatus Saccharibacteria bacterium]